MNCLPLSPTTLAGALPAAGKPPILESPPEPERPTVYSGRVVASPPFMSFSEYIRNLDFAETARRISGDQAFRYALAAARPAFTGRPIEAEFTANEVQRALDLPENGLGPEDFMALLSPAADAFLEPMAARAQALTRKRFGRTVQLYAPMYLSNVCFSKCTYCGFSYGNEIRRLTLTPDQAEAEAEILYQQGIRHILLLTGEAYRETPPDYIGAVIERLARKFASVSIEVYPLKEAEYAALRARGLDGLAVYQETYDPVRYRETHLKGMKSRMQYRLDCPDRGGRAGLRRIAVGALLGLSDPAADAFFTGLHARYLLRNYWQTQISLSLPRLRPAEGLQDFPAIPDRMYARFLFALRIFLPDAGLVLSTREPARLRDELAGLCITQMSAGSRTEPGGYSNSGAAVQFEIEDARSIAEVQSALEARGLDAVFTDWAAALK